VRASDPEGLAALIARFGDGIKLSSAPYQSGVSMADVLAGKRYRRVFEIGTFQGVSAAILADFSDQVFTLDLARYALPISEEVWKFLGIQDRIQRIVVRDEDHKRDVMGSMDFDMCFIDGGHNRLNAILDFVLAKERCNEILFHDFPIGMPPELWSKAPYNHRDYPAEGNGIDGVGFLLDVVQPIGVIERRPPYAWWRKG
jgi:predicted O-methyltransferase YrrM